METIKEREFYSDKSVLVTQSRFVVRGKTFAMRNISSVSKYRMPASNSLAIFLGILGFLFLFGETALMVLSVLLIAGGIAMIFLNKDTFSVRITSNSGEANAVISKDEKYIQKIVDAVSEAIIHRG